MSNSSKQSNGKVAGGGRPPASELALRLLRRLAQGLRWIAVRIREIVVAMWQHGSAAWDCVAAWWNYRTSKKARLVALDEAGQGLYQQQRGNESVRSRIAQLNSELAKDEGDAKRTRVLERERKQAFIQLGAQADVIDDDGDDRLKSVVQDTAQKVESQAQQLKVQRQAFLVHSRSHRLQLGIGYAAVVLLLLFFFSANDDADEDSLAGGDSAGGESEESSAGNDRRDASAKAQPPIAEPVVENTARKPMPDDKKRVTKQGLLDRARLTFAWEDNHWESVHHYQHLVDMGGARFSGANVKAELAMAYLSRGRFDSAVATLGGPAATPSSQEEKQVLAAAIKLKKFLTHVRDALRKDGFDVTYPDERLFVAAVMQVPHEDDYLLLNLVDTWVAEFPESLLALNRNIEINTRYALSPPALSATSTPELRRQKARYRATSVLHKMHELDENNPDAAVRLLEHSLLFHKMGTGLPIPQVSWNVMFHPQRYPSLSDKQKALLLYAKSIHFLDDGGWENGIAELLADWMDEAVTLDPESSLYPALAASIRADVDKINAAKFAQQKKLNAESRALAQKYFPNSNTKRKTKFEEQEGLRWAIFNGTYSLLVEGLRKSNPDDERTRKMTDFMNQLGCVSCWGTGRLVPWDKSGGEGTVCRICGGDGGKKE